MNVVVPYVCVAVWCVISALGDRYQIPEEQKRANFWATEGQKTLNAALRLQKMEKKAKNVILFLGDGMGMTTVTSMRIYKGQKKKKSGEDEQLVFDEFPYVSLSKTYGADVQTSDSANTATAYMCGVKANYKTLGVDGRVLMDDCEASVDRSTHVDSILKWAQDAGKWTGFATTTRVTHATPAGLYAHTASREWESSTPNNKCTDIAHQLVRDAPGKDIRVILGGGTQNFIPSTMTDAHGMNGSRKDNRNLLAEWESEQKSKKSKSRIVFDVDDLKKVDPDKVDYLLGLFHSNHIPYVADMPEMNKKYPSLSEMTEMAIKILRRNSEGYFLFVEGGLIDLAHHMNWGMKALEEGVEFDKAIETALKLTSTEDTLIVVTADHSQSFTIGGNYPLRGNNILGIGGVSDIDNMTLTTLAYHSGTGYKNNSRQRNLTEEEAIQKDFRQDALLPMKISTHGAEDVAVYAKGPMAHLFHGVHDESYIAYAMAYALCVGPNQDLCSSALSVLISSRLMDALRLLATIALMYVIRTRTSF